MNHSAIGIFLLGVFVNGIVLKESSCKKAVLKKFIKFTESTSEVAKNNLQLLSLVIWNSLQWKGLQRKCFTLNFANFARTLIL